MKNKCKECGMIRPIKDLVKIDSSNYLCFSCWNKNLKEKKSHK